MTYKISYRSSFECDFKKMRSNIQNFVLDIADKIDKRVERVSLKSQIINQTINQINELYF